MKSRRLLCLIASLVLPAFSVGQGLENYRYRRKVIVIHSDAASSQVLDSDVNLNRESFGRLSGWFYQLDPEVLVESVQLSKIEELPDLKLKNDLPIVGVIFLGHGNDNHFVLNADYAYNGENALPAALAVFFKLNKIDSKLFLYFSGCATGKQRRGFVRTLFDRLSQLQPELKERIVIIGHRYLVGNLANPIRRPFALDYFFYRSGVGYVVDSVSAFFGRLVGPYGATVVNAGLLTSGIFGALTESDRNTAAAYIAGAFGLIAIRNLAATSASVFGRSISSGSDQIAPVRELIDSHYQSYACERIFN